MGSDAIKDFLDRFPIGLLFFAFALYLGYGYYSFMNSPDMPYAQRKVQVEQLRSQNAKLQKQINDAKQFFQTLKAKREELRALAEQLDEQKAILTEDLDIAGFVKLVVTEARKVGLKVKSIKPLKPVESEFYTEQPFDFEFHGVYGQLLVFMERLASIERIVRVDDFQIKAAGNAGPFVELEGKLQIKTYRYKGSKADELAKAGGSEPGAAPAPAATAGGKR